MHQNQQTPGVRTKAEQSKQGMHKMARSKRNLGNTESQSMKKDTRLF